MQCSVCNANLDDGRLGFRTFDVEDKKVAVCLPCGEGELPLHLHCTCPDAQHVDDCPVPVYCQCPDGGHVDGCSVPAELKRRAWLKASPEEQAAMNEGKTP